MLFVSVVTPYVRGSSIRICKYHYRELRGKGMAIKLRENPLQGANTHTQSKTCYAVWSFGNGESVAAAESGTFFNIKGNDVYPVTVATTSDFYDVHGFAQDDVWAVGTFGAIWRFNGVEWAPIENNPTQDTYDPTWFEAVWGRSSNDLYICGDNSEIIHFDGNEWHYLLKWDRVSPNPYPDRWYSLAGLDDGTIYAVGSPYEINNQWKGGVVRIRPGQEPELLDAPTKTPFINAIARIPNTDELLLCGGDGTLCRIIGNRITREAKDVVQKNDKLYAIDAIDENNIIVVGWSGVLLHFKDGHWTRRYMASRPFLEGIAYCGNNMYTAVGWMGKILSYDVSNNHWSCLHNGRVNETNSLAISHDDSLIASCGGNLIVRTSTGNYQQYLPCSCDVTIAVGLGNGRALLAGNNGYTAEVSVQSNGRLVYHHQSGENAAWAIACGTSVFNDAFLGCSDLAIRMWSNGTLTEIEGVATLLQGINEEFKFTSLQCVNKTTFLARLNTGYSTPLDTYLIDLKKVEATRLDIAEEEVVVTDNRRMFVISSNAIYRVTDNNDRDRWEEVVSIKSHWLSSDEIITSATISNGNFVLGGSRGTVLFIDAHYSVSSMHSGSYSNVTSIACIHKSVVYVGLRWGRVKRLEMKRGEIEGYSISAPTWWGALATSSGTLICGQDGALGMLNKDEKTVELQQSYGSKDYLCCVKLNSTLMCLAGVEKITLWRESESPVMFSIANFVFTTANYFNGSLYLGTSNGQVLIIPDSSLQSRQFSKVSITYLLEEVLPSPIVDLSVLNNGIRLVCENGEVYFVDDTTTRLFDVEGTLKRGAIPQNTEDVFMAGNVRRQFDTKPTSRMVVIKSESLSKTRDVEMPTKFGGRLLTKEVSAYAQDEKEGFWFGGQSGELVILVDDEWFQVSTGIGNHLQSITSAHDRLFVCGRFGAVRFGDMDIFRARIAELRQPQELRLEAQNGEPTPMLMNQGVNLELTERRVLDMFEGLDEADQQLPID
jgi:hypothetical protein